VRFFIDLSTRKVRLRASRRALLPADLPAACAASFEGSGLGSVSPGEHAHGLAVRRTLLGQDQEAVLYTESERQTPSGAAGLLLGGKNPHGGLLLLV
jgi:hypothetical protein